MKFLIFKKIFLTSALSLSILLGSFSAQAVIPGVKGMDHVGMTVPNIAEAEEFFSNVLGCVKATSFGPFRDDKGTFMQDLLDVNPRAVINQITLMRCGHGSNIELFEYTSPDQLTIQPSNSDIGGHHIAFYVEDINAAVDYLKAQGLKTFLGPLPVNEGPAAGQAIMYFQSPWGQYFEVISYPEGMAYEKDSDTILWSTRNPSK